MDVKLEISANAEWVAVGVPPSGMDECYVWDLNGRAASNITTGLRAPSARQPPNVPTRLVTVVTSTIGVATAWLRITGQGAISLSAVAVRNYDLKLEVVAPITINGVSAGAVPGAVAKLKLQPAKSHKHCGDLATIIATAKDANGAPVANAKVTFSADGDCHIYNSQEVKTTDSNGIATYTFGSYDPCRASVVAASKGANGDVVLSDVSYVYFVEGHGPEEREYYHEEERSGYGEEREYYRG
jgi:hypothetical protein